MKDEPGTEEEEGFDETYGNGKEKGKGKSPRSRSVKRRAEKDESSSDESQRAGRMWEDMDVGLPEVLPTELLGWLMLRRCNLTPQQRLNVLSSVGNSMKADDVERGLRSAEDELRLHEQDRGGKGKGGRHQVRANFWVEKDGEWGLLSMEDGEYFEDFEEIHWVGRDIAAVYASTSSSSRTTSSSLSSPGWSTAGREGGYWHCDDGGNYSYWTLHADGKYYHEDAQGVFWK